MLHKTRQGLVRFLLSLLSHYDYIKAYLYRRHHEDEIKIETLNTMSKHDVTGTNTERESENMWSSIVLPDNLQAHRGHAGALFTWCGWNPNEPLLERDCLTSGLSFRNSWNVTKKLDKYSSTPGWVTCISACWKDREELLLDTLTLAL